MFFGETDATHWRPWAVPHVLLQPSSHQAADIGVDDAVDGFSRLLDSIGVGSCACSWYDNRAYYNSNRLSAFKTTCLTISML